MRLLPFVVAYVQDVHPVPAYLVQTDDGRNVLIDTGYRAGSYGEVPGSAEAFIKVAPEGTIIEQLAAIGVLPGDIDILVATHLDGDHAGFHDAFPNAEIVIQQGHLAFARDFPGIRMAGGRRWWDAPGLRYREIEGDTELLPGIELIASGGHVPGHQSVLLLLPETGPVLLAIDAIPALAYADPEADRFPSDLDPAASTESVRKLNGLAAERDVKLVVYGHDAEQWRTLRLAPGFYA